MWLHRRSRSTTIDVVSRMLLKSITAWYRPVHHVQTPSTAFECHRQPSKAFECYSNPAILDFWECPHVRMHTNIGGDVRMSSMAFDGVRPPLTAVIRGGRHQFEPMLDLWYHPVSRIQMPLTALECPPRLSTAFKDQARTNACEGINENSTLISHCRP